MHVVEGHAPVQVAPRVVAIDQTIERIRAAGKTAGILVDRDNARRYLDQGVAFHYVHANAFLSHGAAGFAEILGHG